MRQQRALVLVLLGVVSILSVYIVLATQFAYGPVLVRIGETHGVHVSDLPVLGLWGLAGLATWALWSVDDR